MRNLNHTMDRLTNRWWKLPIVVFLLLILGVVFWPPDSVAQAVPPRSQGLQMIRPLVPQPEPPVEKEIRTTRQEVQKNKEGLKMTQQELENARRFLQQIRSGYQTQLGNFFLNPLKDTDVQKALKECKLGQCKECIYKGDFVKIVNKIKAFVDQTQLDNFFLNPLKDTDVRKALKKCKVGQSQECICKDDFVDIVNKIKTLWEQSGHP